MATPSNHERRATPHSELARPAQGRGSFERPSRLFPGIHTIFRRNPFTFAAILLPFGLEIRVLVFGFWVIFVRTFQRNAAPTLAPPMREPPWRGR